MVVYHQFPEGELVETISFILLLTAAGFLMKGLPAVVFQGTTLLAYLPTNAAFGSYFPGSIFCGVSFLLIIEGITYLSSVQ